MSDQTKPAKRTAVTSRILFTGGANRVIDDLMAHFPEGYLLDKCPASELSLASFLEIFHPNVIIACLAYESDETVKMYSILEKTVTGSNMLLLAVGSQEDTDLFRDKIKHDFMEVYIKPVNLPTLMLRIDDYLASLPCNAPAAPPPPEPEPELPAVPSKKTILVVDDDARMLNVIKFFLQDLYDVVVVPSGKLAMKYLSKKPADLMLLDYMMPEEDGPAVLQRIRTDSQYPNLPVVFLTGVAEKGMVLRGLEHHPNGYLLKPVTRELLVEKVTEILLGL